MNPKGPADSFDSAGPGCGSARIAARRFYAPTSIARYVAGGHGKGEVDTGTNHLGFHWMRDPKRNRNGDFSD